MLRVTLGINSKEALGLFNYLIYYLGEFQVWENWCGKLLSSLSRKDSVCFLSDAEYLSYFQAAARVMSKLDHPSSLVLYLTIMIMFLALVAVEEDDCPVWQGQYWVLGDDELNKAMPVLPSMVLTSQTLMWWDHFFSVKKIQGLEVRDIPWYAELLMWPSVRHKDGCISILSDCSP